MNEVVKSRYRHRLVCVCRGSGAASRRVYFSSDLYLLKVLMRGGLSRRRAVINGVGY